jgi:hypothetical protein
MEMTMTRHTKPRAKRPLSAEKLQRREAVFELYRDMGPGRTQERLIEMARAKYGPISKRTLVNWSQQHNWRARLAEHDQRLRASPPPPDELDPKFNRVEAVERIADQALQRALSLVNGHGKPQEVKACVEAAEKALMLAEKLRELGKAGHGSEQCAGMRSDVHRVMDYLAKRTRERHAAEGHPIPHLTQEMVDGAEVAERETEDARPTDIDGAATVH